MNSLELRRERLSRGGVSAALMPVGDATAPADVGFEPVGEASSTNSARLTMPAAITQLEKGYRTVLARLVCEAVPRGADGVVGIRIEHDPGPGTGTRLWTFTALGTAVRSTGRRHTRVPVQAIRVLEPWGQSAQSMFARNSEIVAYTEVVNACRRQARADFHAAAVSDAADGAVVSDIAMRFEPEAEVATATITGTASARFRTPSSGSTLTILPLR